MSAQKTTIPSSILVWLLAQSLIEQTQKKPETHRRYYLEECRKYQEEYQHEETEYIHISYASYTWELFQIFYQFEKLLH